METIKELEAMIVEAEFLKLSMNLGRTFGYDVAVEGLNNFIDHLADLGDEKEKEE